MQRILATLLLLYHTNAYSYLGYGPQSRMSHVKKPLALDCPRRCPSDCDDSVSGNTKCPYGDSLVFDECNCECRVCARQLGEVCSGMNPCDDVKNLYCDATTRTCKNLPGRPCLISGHQYASGDQFQPNCNLNCTCLNGDIGCMPACQIDLDPTEPACRRGHKAVRVPDTECCDKWECVDESTYEKMLKDRYKDQYKRGEIVAAKAIMPEQIELIRRTSDDCLMQTTSWGECSKSCGIGISERVSNNNDECELKREVRLCNIRPCRNDLLPSPKKGYNPEKCATPVKSRKIIRLSFSGCLSEKSFRPKFCPNCGPNVCCRPKTSVTKQFNLICDDTQELIQKDYQWIEECECSKDFCGVARDIFYGFHAMGSDTVGNF